MVTTRRGTTTRRIEDQRERLEEFQRERARIIEELLEQFGSDTDSNPSTTNEYHYEPEQPDHTLNYHRGHPHAHPGHYTDQDEHHRHRLADDEEKTEIVRPYKRRKALF